MLPRSALLLLGRYPKKLPTVASSSSSSSSSPRHVSTLAEAYYDEDQKSVQKTLRS